MPLSRIAEPYWRKSERRAASEIERSATALNAFVAGLNSRLHRVPQEARDVHGPLLGVMAAQVPPDVEKASRLAQHQEVGPALQVAVLLLLDHRLGDPGVGVGELAAEPAAEIGLLQLHELRPAGGADQLLRLLRDPEGPQDVARLVIGDLALEGRPDVLRPQHLDDVLGELEEPRGQLLGPGAPGGIALEELRIAMLHGGDAGAGDAHDLPVAFEDLDQVSGGLSRLLSIARIDGGLAAAGLLPVIDGRTSIHLAAEGCAPRSPEGGDRPGRESRATPLSPGGPRLRPLGYDADRNFPFA
jgi:hypothetical protein